MVPGWDVLESAQRQDPGRATHSSTNQHEVQRLPAPSGSWRSNLEEVLCNRDLHFLFGIAARIKKKAKQNVEKSRVQICGRDRDRRLVHVHICYMEFWRMDD